METRSSKRIFNRKNRDFSCIHVKLGEMINLIKNENEMKKKIDLYSDFYVYILENFDLLTSNKSQLNSVNSFLNVLLYKGEDNLNILKSSLERGEKIKMCCKRYFKIYSAFEKKYKDYLLQSLIHTLTPIDLELKNDLYHHSINDCPICFETIKKKDYTITNCNHYFHKICLAKSILDRRTCPICRSKI